MKYFFFLICLTPLYGGDWDISLNSDTYAAYETDPTGIQGEGSLTWRLRLNATYDFAEYWQWEGAFEVQQSVRENLQTLSLPIWLRRDDFDRVAKVRDNQVWLQNLDRFRLTYDKDRWRVTLGRQTIGHGNGRFFNPSDIFAPLSPFTLNTQYKSGVDGLRVTRGVGEMGEAEIIALFPEHGDGVFLARYGTSVKNTDLSIMAGESYGEFTLAYDLAGTLAGAAWYTEGIWRQGDSRKDTYRLMAGFSRRFGTKTDFTFETHYHNLDFDNILELILSREFLQGEFYYQRPHHVAMSVSFELHPLIWATGSVIGETEDGSARLQLGVAWDVSESASFSAGYLTTEGGSITEFGPFSDTLYAELRITWP